MTLAANYDDVVDQLLAAGLRGRGVEDGLRIGAMVRTKVDGDREKRGWYLLHELRTDSGDTLIVGSFGVWRGTDNGATKVELRKREISAEQREALRARLAEDRKRADQARAAEAERAARRAQALWSKLAPSGDSPYLERKGVGAYGLRFSPKGAAVVPVCDAGGRIHGLQILHGAPRRDVPAKQFWPTGMVKRGHFHLFGGSPVLLVLVAEGYATGATLHAATGHPVAVAFDAGNLAPVCQALRKRYRGAKILVCADDDSFSDGNPGVTAASTAAVACDGAWVAPTWSADSHALREARAAKGDKLTDFNDLQHLEGLAAVRAVVEGKLTALKWRSAQPAALTLDTGGAGQRRDLRPINDLDALLKRYALVYAAKGVVFDFAEHQLVALSDMRDACQRRELHRAWQEHPDRMIVRLEEVGFDPAGDDPNIRCNLWAGWPTTPKAGKCDKLLELLWHMTEHEPDRKPLFDWMLRWLAYPIQHPGAKMKTTLVVHGPQGTGKNLFFEAVMGIYGRYGRVIDQTAIEDKFNDWASRKLFLIADEVVARSDLYHVKNKLKAFITGDWIRINAKNLAAYDERNHVNMVFLSNEAQPVVIEEDDRRHAVLWTPGKLPPDFYKAVLAELNDGGVAALHDYLLRVDLGEFNPGTLPPYTDAKRELAELSLDSPSKFFYDLEAGQVGTVPLAPCPSQDLYDLYRAYCARAGNRHARTREQFINAWDRKHNVRVAKKRYADEFGNVHGPVAFMMVGRSLPPDGVTEQAWLGQCLARFRTAAKDYREMAYAA